jgi:integrase/recombinase XerC
MNQLAPRLTASCGQPHIAIAAAGDRAQTRFWEFFAAQIRNKHTRRAYAQATQEFLAWRQRAGVASIADVKPLHVTATVE